MHKEKKFIIKTTEIIEGNCYHVVMNSVTQAIKTVPHSILEGIVDFETTPVLLKTKKQKR